MWQMLLLNMYLLGYRKKNPSEVEARNLVLKLNV